jgi:Tfp pilus assembly protein PilX
MMKMKRIDEGGFVSLFTCILISLLLLVVTMSMVSLETLQLRKSEDSEQTLRAYYTAEAGVEDAVAKVLSNQVKLGVGDNTCTPNGSTGTTFDSAGSAGWTCQQITFSGTPSGRLDTADEARTVDPGPGVGFKSLIVQWGQSTNTNAAFYNMPTSLPNAALGQNYLAPVELTIVQYPNGNIPSNQVQSQVKLQNMLIIPGGASSGNLTYNSGAGSVGLQRGNCAKLPRINIPPNMSDGMTTGYNCYALIDGFDSNLNYVLRIRSRYTASAYQMVFKPNPNGNGNHITVPDGTATIDVTAKAGQTYRRVISKLPLTNGAAAGLNFVIYSDGNVCKNFDVIDNVPDNPPGC